MHRCCRVSIRALPAIAVLVGLALAPPAVATDLDSHDLVLLPEGQDPISRASLRVIDASDDNLLLEFTLPALRVQALDIDGQTYHVLEIAGGAVDGLTGEPMLPTFSRLIQIPDRAGVSFEARVIETTELPGYRPFPMQPEELGHPEECAPPRQSPPFAINHEAYARDGYPESFPVRIGEPAIARDLRVVPITLAPVRYDPARETIEVASRIQVQVTFAGVDLRNAKQRHARVIPRSFDQLYRNLVVNYEGPREDQAVSLGSYVIICPNNSTVISVLQPLVEWRTRKGHDVYLATTAETGSTREQIKAWLENAYNTWENPPEYVVLVGDVGGPIALPCWYYIAETDHPYVKLDGNDILADAHIGRISVDNMDRLALYVTKIVGYESTPYMEETDWYTRACLVGDPNDSGITCVQVMQWVKLRLLEHGYTEVDTIFAPPWVSQMLTSLNRGNTVFSYRGFWGTSGLSTGHILALTNGWKMPYAVTITCGTGDFASGTCISEAWIRAGVPPDTPTGGIAAVSTSGNTHTRYNNCMTYGIWGGVFREEMYTFGESLTRGKYELYINYQQGDPGGCANFTHWNNLMGDPAGEIWTAVPRMLSASYPPSIPLGTNSVTVTATSLGHPCAGAYVCLWKDGEVHVGGYTGPDGSVELPIHAGTTGDMLITVTKHDHHPHLATIRVLQADHYVGYFGHTIDDDDSGSSSGNSDHQPNPTEQLELPVWVRNYGTQTAHDVTGTLTSNDPYLTISDGSEVFGDIDPGTSVWSKDDFDVEIDAAAPNGHLIRLALDLQSGTESWHSLMDFAVVSAEFIYDDVTLYDMGSQLDPGDEGQISLRIRNAGDAPASDVSGTLVSHSDWITVTDAEGSFGSIDPGSAGENTTNRFGISVADNCFQGHVAAMALLLQFSDGARDTVNLALEVGQSSSDDPTGPDAYGYYAFDNTDTGYSQAPTYDWIEIAANYGGPGIDVGLDDFVGWSGDDSRTVDLPFPFTFYGETFTRATICSNGWMSMGATYLENRRNWNIPAAGAPPHMIAPMWDNLYQSGDNRVYHWYDETNHRYIVQWSRLRNNQGGATENFELILHDPAHYPTATGDGEIVFQYETFTNSDYVQHYCTVGIENADQTDGVMYSYFNLYNAGAATISSGRAIKFVPLGNAPRGTLSGTITNDTSGGTPLGSASIRLLQTGETLASGDDGAYSGEPRVGSYTVTATHPSFAPDTAYGVWIVADQTTVLDFALRDTGWPGFSQTTVYPNTGNTGDPYEISSRITDYSAFADVSLIYNVSETGWVTLPMADQGDDLFAAAIPEQPRVSHIEYYIYAADLGGNTATDPRTPELQAYEFWVLDPLFEDDMEAGAGDWNHYLVSDGFVDQWHHSAQHNHSTGGSCSWKFGDEAGGSYADLADGALETVPVTIDGEATLTFWHWIDAETSQSDPGQAYDGGLVELSIDGGDWEQITPVGDYPYAIRPGSVPGPFPTDTPVYSGTADWTRAQFELDEITGSVRLRFRFGSDGAVNGEGWYIDDVEIVPAEPDLSGAQELEAPPSVVALYQNTPNPFGAPGQATRIRFDLPRPSMVRLEIFDANGRHVQTLVDGTLPAGRHALSWPGRDRRAQAVPSGVYFYVLQAEGQEHTQRLLIVR
jgi:hypothetical protein